MIRVEKPNLTDADWIAATTAGTSRADKHIDDFNARREFQIDQALYKRYMRFLLALFRRKCAYCEVQIDNSQPGDVEHFRPKGRVVDENFKPIRVDHPAFGNIDHPGYFWLAYTWTNLFPSCADCNRYRKHGGIDQVSGAGKADRFPVENVHTCVPGDEHLETPLLVNPSEMNPAEHLDFRPDGTIVAKTAAGYKTLEVLGLNLREGLVVSRRRAFSDATNRIRSLWTAIGNSGEELEIEDLREQVNKAWAGEEPHTVMQRMALLAFKQRMEARGFPVPLPVPPHTTNLRAEAAGIERPDR